MGWRAEMRAMETAQRRQQREAQQRQRELERRAEEQAKLSALEQARLEVETHENQLEVLLSVHKEQGETWDWASLAVAMPPPCPQKNSYHEYNVRQRMAVLPAQPKEAAEAAIEEARSQDQRALEEAKRDYVDNVAEWDKLRSLAQRILAGEHKAYTEALAEFSPFAEISDLGSSIHFTVHTAKLIECVLKVNGRQAIPAEVKTLTASGKVSIKPMPKGRFHEIYQDYLCGCVLRVAREVFALLPVETVLLTAVTDSFDSRTGQTVEQPVLSVVMPRAAIARLNFDRLDPSDSMENFLHRGDFKASRKSEAFQPITPLTPSDIPATSVEDLGIRDLLSKAQSVREELRLRVAELTGRASASVPQENQSL
jgi:hypothetical protein